MDSIENAEASAPNAASIAPAENTEAIDETPAEPSVAGCRSCGNSEIEGGYRCALCAECRDTMARRPLPKMWGINL